MTDTGHDVATGVGLAGLRVLDFGRYIAGPFCGALLADQGAEVIRVEKPGGGADRTVMPLAGDTRGALYMQTNRNKKSLVLDFGTPDGRALLDRLIAETDVVLVNMPPRALAKLGLDYETLCRIKPDIILTTVSAFASDGPDGNRVGFDGTGQALSGAMYLTGTGEMPLRAAAAYVDYGTAQSAAFATLAAVFERAATGRGQHVKCSLLGTALTMMNPMLMEEATGSRRRVAVGNRTPIAGPSDLFQVRDGWIMVQVIGDEMFRRWTALMNRSDLDTDPRFATDLDRGENGAALSAIMAEWCADMTTADCLAVLEEARVPGCPVLTPEQSLRDVVTGDYAVTVPMPDGEAELPIIVAGRTAASDRMDMRLAPELGAHTDEILERLGLNPGDITDLRSKGII